MSTTLCFQSAVSYLWYCLHNIDLKSIQSIYEFAPHLAEKTLPPRLLRPVNTRDMEIYRLHTIEKKDLLQSLES
jgi:hypothetical protein